MSMMNVLSTTLIILILFTCLTLFFGVRSAQAGVLQTPTGGFGVINTPAPAPRPDGFGTTIGGDPNV